ncbi:hypothetical protein EDB85DRAFT_1891679 [Lactarius pseudohatsudake]|nr:hypothetical protein EDB85DRAFT_1891679 [Lactarius pseudohatsudake]
MGNAEVIDAVMEELNVNTLKPDFCENLKLVTGDQPSIVHLWVVLAARAGNEGGASSLRGQSTEGSPWRGRVAGDMIFENAMLFLHDGLILQGFSNAIKSGDFGHVLLVLKLWALSFQESRRSRYHDTYKEDCPQQLACEPYQKGEFVCLVGLDATTLELLDQGAWFKLLCKPLILQLNNSDSKQNYYQAHGSGASLEWLAMTSPCIEILWQLATEVNSTLGSKQGNRHTSTDLTKDIKILMDSLKQNNVYEEVLSHTLGDNESPAPDVIVPKFPQSEDNGLAHNDPEVPDNDELRLRLDEEMEQSLNDTQPVLSLQTADDINLEMDAGLQERSGSPGWDGQLRQ